MFSSSSDFNIQPPRALASNEIYSSLRKHKKHSLTGVSDNIARDEDNDKVHIINISYKF